MSIPEIQSEVSVPAYMLFCVSDNLHMYHTVRVYRDGPGLVSIIVYLRNLDDHFQFAV